MGSNAPASGLPNAGWDRMPGWARRIDRFGKRLQWEPTPAANRWGRRAGYVAAIVVNAILYYVVHNLRAWGVPFVTPAFDDVLWAVDISLWATIVANALFLVYEARWFRDLIQIVLSGIALMVTAVLYSVFPFDFGQPSLNSVVQFALIALMIAMSIAILVQVIAFPINVTRRILRT